MPPASGAVRLLRALVVAIGATVLGAGGSRATTFVRMDPRDLAASSAAAVIGRVVDVRSEPAAGGATATVATIVPEAIVLGSLPPGDVMVRERGGAMDGRAERVFGAARYQVGERVLAFLSAGPDGSLHTTAMAMGKYHLDVDRAGTETATRAFEDEVAVIDPATGRLETGNKLDGEALAALLERLPHRPIASPPRSPARRRSVPLAWGGSPFTYLGDPSRWFDPDDGQPVVFRIDPAGDPLLGPVASSGAALAALRTWSSVDGSSLLLQEGTLDGAAPFDGCDGVTRIVFDDPFDEIDPPVDCRGVLGIGGYCYRDERRVVNGESFLHIELGKVTLADGWDGCALWTPCNLAEIITHEVGHAIGLGHSADPSATMAATVHFDGRCAGLGDDDVAGVRAIYPPRPTVGPRPTSTRPPPSPTFTLTPPPRPTPTPQPTGDTAVEGQIAYYRSGVPVSAASVTMRGQRAVEYGGTAADGRYAFLDLTDQAWSIEPSKSAGTGFAVSALDAALVLQFSAGLRSLDPAQRIACDVTGGAGPSGLDAARILEFVVGELDRFPVAERCSSDWVFFPDPAPTPEQVVTAPSFEDGGCQRGAVLLGALHGDVSHADFRALVFGDCTANWVPVDPQRTVDREMAPPGTAVDLGTLLRRPGGRWLQPITMHAPHDVHALELDVRYDPARLQFTGVRDVHLTDPVLIASRSPQPGRVVVAAASAQPLPADGRPLLVVEFSSAEPQLPGSVVRVLSAIVDEGLVPRAPVSAQSRRSRPPTRGRPPR